MPCDDCGHMLVVDYDDTSLFCPRCNGLPVESNAVVQATTTWLLEDYFTDENIIQLLGDYSRSNLILYLLTRLNHISNVFFQENGLPVNEFGYLAYILKQVYETNKSEFGDKQLQDARELDEEIHLVQETYTTLISAFRDARNEFAICVKKDSYTGQIENFTSNYKLYQSEFGLCFERCVKSILCGDWDNYEDYSYVSDVLRSVDKTNVDDVDTVEEFADAWYQYILQLRLLASSDDMVGDTYYTRLPDDVTIFDIEEFLDRIDSQFTDEQHTLMQKEGVVCALDPGEVDQCGRQAFGSSWADVRDSVIISEDNLDAHPFLFEMEITEERQVNGFRRPREIQTTKVFYPRYYARILKFQVFPLLKNGDQQSGHQLLANLTAQRGGVYERNLYDFLTDRGIECYHGAEITKAEPNEIDLLCIFDDSIRFVEVKYLMPPIRINDPEGIRVLEEGFDRLIFNEVNEGSDREAKGKPYPEKVGTWTELESDDSFTSLVGPEAGNREAHKVSAAWAELDVEMYVVSNVVPPYLKKQGVRFLTDLEFYRWIGKRDEDFLYSLPEVEI